MRVLYCGVDHRPPSPAASLAEMLASAGCDAQFARDVDPTTAGWIKRLRGVDVVVYMGFGAPGWWLLRQMKIARAMGRPVVRWWVGTDALRAISDPLVTAWARQFDRIASGNVAVAPHLVEELAEIGIAADLVPIVPDITTQPEPAWQSDWARAVLVYLPENREEFYRAEILDRLVQARPDFTFYLVANSGKRYEGRDNVVPLGWLDDMAEAYDRVGCLLRLTEHDGCPRMIIEALAMGKYVVHSWPFAGCMQAGDFEQARDALDEIARKTGPNLDGVKTVAETFCPKVAAGHADEIFARVRRLRWLKAAWWQFMLTGEIGRLVRKIFRRPAA